MAKDRQLRNEIESLMLLLVETYNPSDRGVRFITGGIGEWMLAFAAYSAGVLSMPAGHNANGFDLAGLLAEAKRLWSVKGSNRSGGRFHHLEWPERSWSGFCGADRLLVSGPSWHGVRHSCYPHGRYCGAAVPEGFDGYREERDRHPCRRPP